MDTKSEDHVSIIVQNLMGECDGIGTNAFSPSIYMAPSTFRNHSPNSFTPRVVSIGPLHRNDENLKQFEGRKAIFVKKLWDPLKSELRKDILTACVKKVDTKINKIKGCYVDIKGYTDIELVNMMVVDASFILGFILQIPYGDKSSMLMLFDNLSSKKKMLLDNYIPYDLFLLENQIPFFVLNDIFESTVSQFEDNICLCEFILPLLKYPNLFQGKMRLGKMNKGINKYDHILAFLHACYKPGNRIDVSHFPNSTIHSVVELDRAGVKFRPQQNAKFPSQKIKNQKADWPLGMELKYYRCSCIFWFLFKPTLRMPKLRINHFTELVLRNLIAYEQSSSKCAYFTSYARAMDMLIDTHEDVAKLVTSKVIVNHLGSNEEAANMINQICKEVVWEFFYYGEEWERLDKYFNAFWPKKIVKLRRTYFNSPWNIIAFFVGAVLFSLAVVQTIFAIKSAG